MPVSMVKHIKCVSHRFQIAGPQFPDLPHEKPVLYRIGHYFRALFKVATLFDVSSYIQQYHSLLVPNLFLALDKMLKKQ